MDSVSIDTSCERKGETAVRDCGVDAPEVPENIVVGSL